MINNAYLRRCSLKMNIVVDMVEWLDNVKLEYYSPRMQYNRWPCSSDIVSSLVGKNKYFNE